MKRCGMWFFVGFVLAILLTLCTPPEHLTPGSEAESGRSR